MIGKVLAKLKLSTSTGDIKNDISAGLSVAAIALPQNMAYALIVGVDPVYGLYTSIVSMVVATFVGVSNYMIVGPTNMMAVAIASGLAGFSGDNYLEAVLLLTFLVGVFQVGLSLLKLGVLINFISRSVVVGLTTGVAIIILVGQLGNFFGISYSGGSNVFTNLYYFMQNLNEINVCAAFIGIVVVISFVFLHRFNPGLPNYLLVMAFAIGLVYLFNWKDQVDVVRSFPGGLPNFTPHGFDFAFFTRHWSTALSVAILGFIQAFSVVKSLEIKSGQEVEINRVFLSQGIINTICSFFSSFSISASFTNSFTNYQSGARSRLSEFITAVTIALFILLFSPLATYIPISALAGLVIIVGFKMIDIEGVKDSFRNKFDMLIFLATFLTTIGLPRLDYAVYFGVIVSFILILKNTSTVNYSHYEYEDKGEKFYKRDLIDIEQGKIQKDSYILINLSGNINFNASVNLKNNLEESYVEGQTYIIRTRDVENIDLTCLKEIEKFIDKVQESGGKVLFTGVDKTIYGLLRDYSLLTKVGEENIFMEDENIFSSTRSAINKVKQE
ncbi:MAG: SulP family inorganic anion transporter [Bacillota bacterium]